MVQRRLTSTWIVSIIEKNQSMSARDFASYTTASYGTVAKQLKRLYDKRKLDREWDGVEFVYSVPEVHVVEHIDSFMEKVVSYAVRSGHPIANSISKKHGGLSKKSTGGFEYAIIKFLECAREGGFL